MFIGYQWVQQVPFAQLVDELSQRSTREYFQSFPSHFTHPVEYIGEGDWAIKRNGAVTFNVVDEWRNLHTALIQWRKNVDKIGVRSAETFAIIKQNDSIVSRLVMMSVTVL